MIVSSTIGVCSYRCAAISGCLPSDAVLLSRQERRGSNWQVEYKLAWRLSSGQFRVPIDVDARPAQFKRIRIFAWGTGFTRQTQVDGISQHSPRRGRRPGVGVSTSGSLAPPRHHGLDSTKRLTPPPQVPNHSAPSGPTAMATT
jgi:hypothetical protein